MKKTFLSVFVGFVFVNEMYSQNIFVKGTVLDKDSITPMSFAYVVNKNSSTGNLSDEAGKFAIRIKPGDTLSFSYLGYGVTKIFTHLLKDSIKNALLNLKIFLISVILFRNYILIF